MKKVISVALSLVLISTVIYSTKIGFAEQETSTSYVDIGKEQVEIGNDAIKRVIDISEAQLNTTLIQNDRINEALVPAEGSEDFVINLVSDNPSDEKPTEAKNNSIPDAQKPQAAIDRSDWAVMIYDAEGKSTDGKKMLDGDDSTYVDFSDGKRAWPYEVVIDLKEEKAIGSFGYQKRPGYEDQAYGVNGTIGKYEIMISKDGKDWIEAGAGEFTAEDYKLHKVDQLYNVGETVYGNLAETQTARYVKIIQLSGGLSNDTSFTGAEIYLYEDTLKMTPQDLIDRKDWAVEIADANGMKKDGAALIDGDKDTIVDFANGAKEWPYTITVDLGKVDTIGSFSYQKRPGFKDQAYGLNGTIGKFMIQVSTDGDNWIDAGESAFTKEEYNLHEANHLHNVGDVVYASLDEPREARYVRILQLSGALSADISFTGAELNLYRDAYRFKYAKQPNEEVAEKISVKASELKVESVKEVDYETGKKVQFTFEKYEKHQTVWEIKYNVFVEDHSPYLRSYIEIASSNEDIAIDYIDVDKFVLADDIKGLFHHPPLKDISSMWIGEYELVLGQPIYANGMFFGSEFPISDTDVVDNTMQVRYYSGKSFAQLAAENKLNKDGSFLTWNSVMGAAAGIEKDVVQMDLFAYIDEIATKTEFRKQYNSWYDNMLDISDESIAESFYGTEKELSKNGVEPLDSYVVDDGWNAYETVGANGQATGSPYKNQTGFWEFNNKFPDELYPASDLAKNFGSTFGLWLGPQGGYNYFGGFAEFLAQNGTGHVNTDYWKSIDVGSKTYLGNLEKWFLDYQERFDIEYWKLDGFAVRPNTDAENDHMVGGEHNMYYTSELWENWIDLFEAMRAERTAKGQELFLNLTCYINPSPWWLQWANTIWLQDSGDIGFLDEFGGTQSDQIMSYRDNVYFNIFKKNDLQFPLKNVYNHDPIYGVSAGIQFTDDDFRNQLMINATRGTAFWELYFSPSIMDDAKWRITADVLDWAENNAKTLEKAKLFGERPDAGGVYGYSAWHEGKGIVSFRNASDQAQTYTLRLDETVGVPTNLGQANMVQVLPVVEQTNPKGKRYGDTLKVTLAPHESRIYEFVTEESATAKVISVKNTGENTVTVKFDQHIQRPSFTVNGELAEATILEDYRTVALTTKEAIQKDNKLKVNVENIWGAPTETTKDFLSYEDGYAAKLLKKTDIRDGEKLEEVRFKAANLDLFTIENQAYQFTKETPLIGKDDFSLSLNLRTTQGKQAILKQEGAYSLELDEEGYLFFKVGDEVVHSKTSITTVDEKATGTFGTDRYKPTTIIETTKGKLNDGNLHDVKAVREANGLLKLYIDGELLASKYVKDAFSLPKGKLSIGGENSKLQIGAVEIKNKAIAYDEVEKAYADLGLQAGFKELDRTNYKAFASSQETKAGEHEGPAKNVLDGKNSTWWHTQYTGDAPKLPHWLTIEMPEVKPVEAYEYVSRNGNGNVKKYELQISNTNQSDDWKTVKSGEMENGGSTLIEFDKPIEAKFYRLYITETYGSPANTFASAAEIKLHQKVAGAADFAKLATTYEGIRQVDRSLYTKESLESSGFNALYQKVVGTYKDPNSTQTQIDALVLDFTENFTSIIEKLTEGSQTDIQSVADLLGLVESFEEAGDFTNKDVARSLKVHLSSVSHYEKSGDTEKVEKHLKRFKVLMKDLHKKKDISEEAFNKLLAATDELLK